MIYLSPLFYLVISFWGLYNPNCNYKYSEVDSAFVIWNKETFQSINRQIQFMADSMQKSEGEMRFSAFKSYLEIENENDINRESVRYRFLKTLFSSFKDKRKSFYVIESNRSGVGIEIRNFVLYIRPKHRVDIDFYIFINGGWIKNGKCNLNNFHLDDDFKSYITKYRLGFNFENIIVSKFEYNSVKSSEFYLRGRLSSKSKIKEVLDCYKKENFFEHPDSN